MIKLTKEQHEFIKTFAYNNYTDGDTINKEKAIFFISRWGWSFALKDGKGVEYSTDGVTEGTEPAPFKQDERFKIINAIINGYEVLEERYHLYSKPYSEVTDQIEKVYFLGDPYRLRSTTGDKKLSQDWGKTYSLDEAYKIKDEFEKLGVVLELEKV